MHVLYIDIETLGLDLKIHDITVIGTIQKTVTAAEHSDILERNSKKLKYTNVTNTNSEVIHTSDKSVNKKTEYKDIVEKCYNVCVARENGTEKAMKTEVLHLLESSQVIVAFNGISFDVPFLLKWLEREDLLADITNKTLDFCDIGHIVIKQRIKLNTMCTHNGITESKYACGKVAITWAIEKNWKELEYYCMQDVVLMCKLTERAVDNGLVLIRQCRNRMSANKSDEYTRVIVNFDSDWLPDVKAQRGKNTTSSALNIDPRIVEEIYEIDTSFLR